MGGGFLRSWCPADNDNCVARTYYFLEGNGAEYMLSPQTFLDPKLFRFVASRKS